MKKSFTISTPRKNCFIDITQQIGSFVSETGIESGVVHIVIPHTTAGITINENADPDVIHDILIGLDKAYPDQASFRHYEGNSTAHLKASAMGFSCTILIEDGQIVFGTWQGVYFCEFDGPRQRKFLIKVISG